jgi:pyrimidine-nucleoside phosphorylase
MNQPLGYAVGNALELVEALNTLRGKGPEDFQEHCLLASGYLLVMGGVAQNIHGGKTMAEEALATGKSLEKFRQLVIAQGGDVRYVDEPGKLTRARLVVEVRSPQSGYLKEINAREVGETAILLGGGREHKGDPIDHSVGVVVRHKVGDYVNAGEVLFTIHANDEDKLTSGKEKLLNAHLWSAEPVEPLPLYYGMIS